MGNWHTAFGQGRLRILEVAEGLEISRIQRSCYPAILHTWGLHDGAADLHHTSFKRFQEMLNAL